MILLDLDIGSPISDNAPPDFRCERMGGGKKKQTLRKTERTQSRTGTPKASGALRFSSEKRVGGIVPPSNESVLSQIKKMRAITPYAVASRLDLRMSVAKDLLRQLERNGKIEFISGSKNIRIYKLVG
ncbi:MAG: 40S ribosomal protein S25 [Candidatus Bathyarchaeota archaeon]|nr:MAG: 40S ribosomal protein S25 [Candidatus Bathyarchaeota archaeon]